MRSVHICSSLCRLGVWWFGGSVIVVVALKASLREMRRKVVKGLKKAGPAKRLDCKGKVDAGEDYPAG